MNVEQLVGECERRLADGQQAIVLVLPNPGRGYTKRLAGRHGPRGEVLCVNANNEAVCRFEVAHVLKFLRRIVP